MPVGPISRMFDLASSISSFSASVSPGTLFGRGHEAAPQPERLADWESWGTGLDFFAPFSQFRALASATFDEAVENALQLGTTMVANGVIGRPSLHEDIVNGRATEVEDSLGTYLAAAEELGIAVPTARGAYRVIKTLEALGT